MAVTCPKCHSENTDTARFCSNCATSLGTPRDHGPSLTKTLKSPTYVVAPGTVIAGHYEVQENLGKGGMGEVHRALDKNLGREVAIKILPEEFSKDPERLARFEREAKLLATLNHPNIAAIYGFEEAEGRRFLVMELVAGETLQTRLDKSALPIDEALETSRQIAEGLEAAHEKGIIHRDLKPGNVMLTPEGKVKILDFGLAKAYTAETTDIDIAKSPTITARMTDPGIILGTAAYMSPEQARSRPVDKRTDIWAFGCVLFECLAGRRAFEGETITDTLAAIVKGEPRWDYLPSDIPRGLRDLIRRCLYKDQRERLRDIADVRIQLVDSISRSQVDESPSRRWGKSRWPAFIGIPLFILAVAGAVLLTWNLKKLPIQPLVRTTIGLPSGLHLARGGYGVGHTEIAFSPDGRSLIYSASRDQSDPLKMLYRRPIDQADASPIPGTEGGQEPVFSPDGQWIIFWAQGILKKLAAAGGGIPSTICNWPDIPLGVAVRKDGTLVIGTGNNGLQMVASDGKTIKRITAIDPMKEAFHVLPCFLPGDHALLFTVKPHQWGTKSNIEILSLESERRKLLIEDGADARYVPPGYIVFLREGTLLAARFDPRTMELKSPAVPVVDGVRQSLNILSSTENSGSGLYSISNSGSLAYVSGGISPDLKTHLSWVDLRGKATPVSQLDGEPIASVRLSPDGRYLAYRTIGRNAQVWVRNLGRGSSQKLTREGRAMHLTWTPDGSRVTFAYSLAGVPNISWMPADGAGALETLVSRPKALQPSDWSPDGKYLVYVENNSDTKEDLWVYQKQDSKTAPLFTAKYNECYPDISPDGKWLAYCTDESGRDEVYVTTFPSSSRKTLVSTNGGRAPLWSPNGRRLYYWNIDGTEMMAVDMAFTPDLTIGTPRSLFKFPMAGISYVRAYDIDTDGSRFIIPGREDIEPIEVTRIELVQNWFEELKRLVPTGKK